MINNSTSAPVQDLIRLHDQLNKDLHDLNSWLKEADEYGRPQFGQLGDRLHAIREIVASHFSEEEQGGYMVGPIAAAPHLAERAAALLADHPRLLAEFDTLSAALSASPITYACWGDARRDVQHVLDHLHAHEHRENELWQEAFGADVTMLD